MNTLVEADVVDDDTVHHGGPGQRLRAAREHANISLEFVAARLHLRHDLIESIENDDYRQVPSFVFVRGYLRAYANLLGLPADQVIEAFNALELEEPESPRQVNQITQPPAWEGQKRQIRWGTMVTVFGLIMLMLIWWQANKTSADDVISTVAIPEPQQVANQTPANKVGS